MSARKLITEHLDLWTGAVTKKSSSGRGSNGKIELTGVKKLRELVLELAVRGKLVEQDLTDEPASKLLEHIAAEKAELAKEGKIKKPKRLPELEKQEEPFDLPNGWLWVRMEAISEYIQRGKGPKYAESGKVRVVSQKCVQRSGFDLNAARFVDDNSLHGYQDERYIRENDILWNSTGTGTVGRAVVVEKQQSPIIADSHVTIIRALVSEPHHILNYISSPSVQQRIEPNHENSLVSGTTKQVELNSASVKSLAVPLPPINEQRRIVQKVDELMALCDQLEQQTSDQIAAHDTLVDTLLGTLTQSQNATELAENWTRLAAHFDTLFTTEQSIDKLKQTILHLAVMGRLVERAAEDIPSTNLLKEIGSKKSELEKNGEIKKTKTLPDITPQEMPPKLPNSWSVTRLGEIAFQITDGAHHTPTYVPQGVPFLSVKDMSGGNLDFSDTRYISETQHQELARRCNPKRGDLLITKVGTTGIPILVDTDREFSLFVSVALVKFPASLIDGAFLKLLIDSPWVKKQSEEGTEGIGNKNLVLRKIRNFVLPIPPLQEQHRIVQKVDDLMAFCDQLKERLNQTSETRCQLAETIVENALQ